MVPKYNVGDRVKFSNEEGDEWLFGWIRQLIRPGEPGNTLEHPHVVMMYPIEHRDVFEVIREVIPEPDIDSSLLGRENKRFMSDNKPGKTTLVVRVSLANSLHDLENITRGQGGRRGLSPLCTTLRKHNHLCLQN